MFIKAASDTVFDMINAVYHDKPLILIFMIFLKFWEKIVSHHRAVNEAVSCLLMRLSFDCLCRIMHCPKMGDEILSKHCQIKFKILIIINDTIMSHNK